MRFSEVAGHSELKKRLIRSVLEERVPHAQMFHGPEGIGSLALSLAYATYLSCTDKEAGDSCGTCPSCMKYDKLIHPDLHFSFPVFTSGSNPRPVSDDYIEVWRLAFRENPYINTKQWYAALKVENKQGIINKYEAESIQRKLSLKAFESNFKVLLMWMPEKMNNTAANKLLKLLEEPPPMTIFLLVAESTSLILPTILSRTQLIKVPKLKDKDLSDALRRSYSLEDEVLENAVNLAEGSYNRAVEIIEKSEEAEYHLDLFIRIMRLTWERKWQKIFEWVEEVGALGRERQKAFFDYAIRMVRENYLLNMQQHELVHLAPQERFFSGKFSTVIHDKNAPSIIREMNDASIHIEANAYARIVLLDFSLNLAKLIR